MFLNIMLLGGSADIAAVAVQSSFSDHIAELISDLGIYFGYAVFEQEFLFFPYKLIQDSKKCLCEVNWGLCSRRFLLNKV